MKNNSKELRKLMKNDKGFNHFINEIDRTNKIKGVNGFRKHRVPKKFIK